MSPMDRVDTLEEFLKCATTCEKPVVYRLKESEKFECHLKWTNEFLESIPITVGVHRASKPSFFDFNHSPVELARSAILRQTTVGDLMQRRSQQGQNGGWEMISGTDTHLVLENGPVERWLPLWSDCKRIANIVPDKLYRVGFWISCGKPGAKTDEEHLSSQMHWDVNGHHNLNFQVRGEKSIIMFAPDDREFLYPMPARLWHLSRIDPRQPADKAHPLFNKAHPVTVDLQEGDVLLIPSGWWHHVTHKGEVNVNLTFWYHSKERSGIKWNWTSFLVPYPAEAWFFAGKVVSALLIMLPPMLFVERFQSAAPIRKGLLLAALTFFAIIPLALRGS